MKELNALTIEDVAAMDYNNIISLVRETNRAPGGYKTIACILNNSFLRTDSRILEIGTSTGVTSIEIAKLLGCRIEAIDINEQSLAEARRRAAAEGVQDRIRFCLGDAQALEYPDASFDMVFCGNVTSLIPNRKRALEEYIRVLKPNGILAAVPMYYLNVPSEKLMDHVRAAIQTDVQVVGLDYWREFYRSPEMVLKFTENCRFDRISDEVLNHFIAYILSQHHLQALRPEVFAFLKQRYREYIYLFRDNLSRMGYSILLYKKEPVNREPELFTGSPYRGDGSV